MQKKTILGTLLCIGLMLLVQYFAGVGVAQEKTSTKTLRIGAIMSLSGTGATLGIPFRNALIMQSDEYNKAGGIDVGKQKYKIEVIIEDDRYSAEGARVAGEKLIYQDKVKFILGPIISPACIVMSPISQENRVIQICAGSSPKVLDPKYTYTFRPYTTSVERSPAQYNWMSKNLTGIKRICTIDIDDESGHATTVTIKKNAEANGFEVCPPVFFPRGTSEFFPLMTKIVGMKPDFIDCGSASMGEVALQVKAARQLGFKGYMSISFPQDYSELCKKAGKEAAEGFILGDTFTPDALPSAKVFTVPYLARWKNWDPYALKFSIYLPILLDSLKVAGTVEDTTKIMDTMEKMEYNTHMGRLRWSGAKTYGIAHQIYTPYGLAKVHNCDLVNLGVLPAQNIMEAMGEK
jgi:branched-chain amino acid transport system substrate-binding protein